MKKNESCNRKQLPLECRERLANALENTGKSYSAIGRETGLSFTQIWSYAHGDYVPTAYTLMILCKYLNVSADYILFGKEN